MPCTTDAEPVIVTVAALSETALTVADVIPPGVEIEGVPAESVH